MNASGLALSGGASCAVSWAKGPKRSPHGSWAHLSYGVRSTPGDATSAETGLVLMRWRGAGDVAASQGLADGQAIAAKHRRVASPRAARGFPAAETGPPLPPNHPHATAPTKAPSARYRRAQSPTMPIYEPVPARVPLHLGVSWADSSRQLTAASPCWEPPPTAPEPMARHPGGGPPALFLPSPPRRWACGQSPERGARPLPPSDYSRCGGAIIAPRGPSAGGAAAGAQQLPAGPFRRAVQHFFCT
eukprot:COSAG01_NODE_1978_length_8747_cov_87.182007_7_plen_246_part_00